jgi:type III protein arginine methyltransferase
MSAAMPDWSKDLEVALAADDPAFVKAMLARVPRSVLQQAVPYVQQMAKSSVADGRLEEALTYYDQLLEVAPDNIDWHADRARVHFRLDQLAEALTDARRIVELRPELALGHRLQGEAYEGLRERPQAVAAYRQAMRFDPNDERSQERIRFLEEEMHKEAILRRALNPDAATEPLSIEPLPTPEVEFDPTLLEQAGTTACFEQPMVEGLKQLLWRYSGHQSSRNTLARLEDTVWLTAWDEALSATVGSKVLLRGSELGTFALQALKHGASRVLAVEQFPLDGRISSGLVQKNLLMQWHAVHGAVIRSWSEEERRTSFAAFAHNVDIVPPDCEDLATAQCDYFVFANIDHSLLGTGIVKAARHYRTRGLAPHARMLPAKAKVFAMGIEWVYPSTSLQLQRMNQFRWNLYPQALELSAEGWTALTEPVCIGEIDFENFAESMLDLQLPVTARGSIDAIMYWFDLQLGTARISNAPDSALSCIKPAVQYTDSIAVEQGQSLPLKVRMLETRFHFQTEPPVSRIRSHALPSWYVPMLLDQDRNDAYRKALGNALQDKRDQVVLDIGAGCGLLSMMAAQAGASRVIGCEVSRAMAEAGNDIVRVNQLDNKVTFVNKDCRSLKVPEDICARADLAVFELFDCSLIGEGVLHFLDYARQHLLKDHARYLPMAGRIRAMVIEYRLDRVWDFDVNLLNPYRFSSAFINVDAGKLRYRALTEPVDIFSFNFATAVPTAQERELRIPALGNGIAGAMLFWFDLQLDETLWLSNGPGNGPGADSRLHWKQGLQFLPEVQVHSAMQLPLIARHDGSSLTFRWKQDEVPKETLSRLPRFDPRSVAAASELEQQTRGLLQHCAQNAAEYAQVARLAQRFAIDPAAHDLDPVIAQRFVATFFGI